MELPGTRERKKKFDMPSRDHQSGFNGDITS